VIRDWCARGIGGTSVAFAWETRTDETARRIIHNDLSVEQRQLGGYVAILSLSWLLTVKLRSRINDRYVWSMARVLARASKGFHLDFRALDSSNGAHYPSYIWKCIKLRSVNCYKNWFLWPLYLRRHRLNLFSEGTGIILVPMHAIESQSIATFKIIFSILNWSVTVYLSLSSILCYSLFSLLDE